MKKLSDYLVVTLIAIFISTPALEVKAQQPDCNTKLSSQLISQSKEPISLPKRTPRGDLLEYIHLYELICPWRVERDFNSDGKSDWAGIVYRENQYQLAAFISTRDAFQLQIIKTYKAFPLNTFLKAASVRDVKVQTENQMRAYPFQYALVETKIKQVSNIYSWNKGKLTLFNQYANKIDVKKIRAERDKMY
ncbi:hypothetical protein [Aliikangiella sp. IMCC44359]|uniref:hypothetical protein n=1 Tax=Aliikangiella sp. IMCC44359 TaxID=3459125 RepID=UPI00403ADD90